jgi:glutathione S-transferase
MLELYDFPNSICAQKVRMTLLEKNLECKKHDVNLFVSAQYDPKYLKLNPKGYVPTLVHDGKAIRESNLICEYLNEVFPAPPLAPSDPAERAGMRLWGKAVDEGLFEAAAVLSFSAMFRERMKQQTGEQRQQRYRNVGDPARRDRYKSTYEEGVDSPYVFRGIAAFEIAFKGMGEALAGGSDWLAGDMFSLAEINLAPMVARLEYLTLLDPFFEGRPVVQAWWQRVKDRPSYVAEITNGISAAEVDEMREFGAPLRDAVADIRDRYLKEFA